LEQHPYARSQATRDSQRWCERAAVWPGSSGGGQGMELICGACVSVAGVREGDLRERCISEEKAYSEKYAKGARVG
jgi:hypothetical protein